MENEFHIYTKWPSRVSFDSAGSSSRREKKFFPNEKKKKQTKFVTFLL